MKNGRLDFIVPGYTGHIPSMRDQTETVDIEPLTNGHIPGYAGYVNKIKPENLYGKSFGKITFDIHSDKVEGEKQFQTTAQKTFVDQSTIKTRTAFEIVGVNYQGPSYAQPTSQDVAKLRSTLVMTKGNSWKENRNDEDCETPSEKTAKTFTGKATKNLSHNDENYIEHSLPGYTGHNRKINSENIYGMTYKQAQLMSKNLQTKENDQNKKEMEREVEIIPPVFLNKQRLNR